MFSYKTISLYNGEFKISFIFFQVLIASSESSFVFTKYITVGLVNIVSTQYSLLILSLTISICSIPKKPHLNPNPKALLSSNSYSIAESFSDNFSKLSLSLS